MLDPRRPSSVLLLLALAACAPWTGETVKWASDKDQLAQELAGSTRPITTSDGALDLEPLWAKTRDARIIGLGESARHVRAFRQIVQAMARRAEVEGQPLIVALDVPFSTGLELDAWAGDAWYPTDPHVKRRELGRSMRFDPQRPGGEGEHVELLSWLREHNAAAPPGRQVRVVGLGPCVDWSCAMWLLRYFQAVDPEHDEEARWLFAWTWDGGSARRSEEAAHARAQLRRVREILLARRDVHVGARGAEAHATALQMVSAMALGLRGVEPAAVMADNAEWLAEQSPEARILVVSRNAHVDRASGGSETMGSRLTARFGDAYVAVHMTFDQGLFVARVGRARNSMNRTGWAPAGTLEAALRRDDTAAYVLDVRQAAADDGPLARYLQTGHWTRAYPDVWNIMTNPWPAAWSRVVPAADFDLLLVVANVHISH